MRSEAATAAAAASASSNQERRSFYSPFLLSLSLREEEEEGASHAMPLSSDRVLSSLSLSLPRPSVLGRIDSLGLACAEREKERERDGQGGGGGVERLAGMGLLCCIYLGGEGGGGERRKEGKVETVVEECKNGG